MYKILILFYLLTASFFDIKYKKFPLLLTILFIILCSIIFTADNSFKLNFFAFLPGMFLFLIRRFSQLALGLGDCVLLTSLGLLLNLFDILYLLSVALFFTSIIGIFLFVKNRNTKQELPFIPFLFLSYLLLFLH